MKNKKMGRIEKKRTRGGYFFIAPGIIGFLVFSLGPMLYSLMLSFTEWNIITPMKYIGLANYKDLFHNDLILKSLKATFYYTLLSVPLIVIVDFMIAVLLNTKVRGISIFRAIFYIPSIIPLVATCAIWMFIYNPTFGLINGALRALHLPVMKFLDNPATVVRSLAIIALWCSGNTVIIYLSGLQSVPGHLYEAARIDGAGHIKCFFNITVPMMTPIIFYNIVMAVINSLQTFTQAYIMTDGGPANASMFLSLLIYKNGFKYQRMGYAAAISWMLFVIVGILTLVLFATSRKWVYYETGGE